MSRQIALACLLLSLLAATPARALPSGRAYEQVTPAGKNGGSVGGPAFEGEFASAFGQSAADGNSISYVSQSSFGGAVSAEFLNQYVSLRGFDGWETRAISPPAAVPPRFIEPSPFRFFASDLSASLLERAEPALAEGAPQGFDNLYVRDASGSYRPLIVVAPPNLSPGAFNVTFAAATPDLSHVVFEANDALTPGAPVGVRSVYEWDGFRLRLVSVLPDGTTATGAGAGAGIGDDFSHVISDDGSRIFWTDNAKQLYVRERGTRTVKLNASRLAASGADGTARLLATTPDGSKAIFTDPVALTLAPDDRGGGIYQYDLETESLRDLTPWPVGDLGVQGVPGMSTDGSVVYFVATAVLTDGAQDAATNLYVARGGEVEFIAVLSRQDFTVWASSFELRSARVTPDGDHVAFLSKESLTGYDNTDAVTGEPDPELFVYDSRERQIVCVSCNPDGSRPTGGASIPAGTSSHYRPRIVSDDGSRVLFNSKDALLPADTNGRQDVYLYEDGRLQLVSGGKSSDISALVDMSVGERDVFFTTRERLVAADSDNAADIYDARIGGGFPISAQTLPCAGEACRGSLSAPSDFGSAVATSSLRGAARRTSPRRCRPRSPRARPARTQRCRKRRGR